MDASDRTAIIRRRAFELARSIVHFLEVTDPVSYRSLQSPLRSYAGRSYGTLPVSPNTPQTFKDSIASDFNTTLPTTSTPKKYVSRLSTSPQRYPVPGLASNTLHNSNVPPGSFQNNTGAPKFVSLNRDNLHWTSLAHSPPRADVTNRRMVSPHRTGGAVNSSNQQRQVFPKPVSANHEIKRTSSKRTVVEHKPDGTKTETIVEQDVTYLDDSTKRSISQPQSPSVSDSGVRSYQPYSSSGFSTAPRSLSESPPMYSSFGGYQSPNFSRQREYHSPTRETLGDLQVESRAPNPSPMRNSPRPPYNVLPNVSQRSPVRSPIRATTPFLNLEEEEALDNLVDVTLQGFAELAKSMRGEVEHSDSKNSTSNVRKLNRFLAQKLVKSEKCLKDLQEDIDNILAEMSCIIANRPISPENVGEMKRAIREEVSKMSEVSITREEDQETPRSADRSDLNPLRKLDFEDMEMRNLEENGLRENTGSSSMSSYNKEKKEEGPEQTNDTVIRIELHEESSTHKY